jgi:hypothetical protein
MKSFRLLLCLLGGIIGIFSPVWFVFASGEQSKKSISVADKPLIFRGGNWINDTLDFGDFFEFIQVENPWSRLLLKVEDYLYWTQTWTGHFAGGEFFQTEAISDCVRLAPVGGSGLYYQTGIYTSTIFNAARPVDWLGASWWYTNLPESVEITYRSGNSPLPDGSWSSWINPRSGKAVCAYTLPSAETDCISPIDSLPSSQYLQYRVFFTSTDATESVALLEIRTDYGIHTITGTATSIAINPIDLRTWQSAIITTAIPTSTTVKIDVLAEDNSVLLSDIGSIADLSGINPNLHPAIKLRVELSTSDVALSPTLYGWRVYWDFYDLEYFPFVSE